MYPIPARDNLFIRVKDLDRLRGVIRIFSREGHLIIEQPLKASDYHDWNYAIVDVSNLKEGYYVVTIDEVSQQKLSSRLIIDR
jgi:hypothetical protein